MNGWKGGEKMQVLKVWRIFLMKSFGAKMWLLKKI